MKYVKIFGLAAVVAAALMAWVGAGTASAITLTDAGGKHYPIGTKVHGESEGTTTLHPPIGSISCAKSTFEATTTTTGGVVSTVTTTVKGHITSLSFTECNASVTVLKTGTLELHSLGNGSATVTSSGTEVTIVFSGFHCIFSTNNTHLGTLTGSTVTKKDHATFDVGATIPRTGGSSGVFCGSTAAWTGAYTITAPKPIIID